MECLDFTTFATLLDKLSAKLQEAARSWVQKCFCSTKHSCRPAVVSGTVISQANIRFRAGGCMVQLAIKPANNNTRARPRASLCSRAGSDVCSS